MEHRRGLREAVSLQVNMEARGIADAKGQVVDLSLGGAFIRMIGGMPAVNSIVQLEFGSSESVDASHRCRALVVRCNEDGIGVMFDRRQDSRFMDGLSPRHVMPVAEAPRMGGRTGIRPAESRVRAPASH
jgi:hypothetical protein